MNNSAEICLNKYDVETFLREIHDIRGDKRLLSFGTIKFAVNDTPGRYPYLTTYFFHKTDKWARNQITQLLSRCGVSRWNTGKGTNATYFFKEV